MVSEFLQWWAAQLLSLRPALAAAGRDALVASVRPSSITTSITASIRRRGKEGELGTFALTPAGMAALAAAAGPRCPPLELHLPPGMMLEQSVVLPLAAERDPERVLRYEMDRLTPFAATELYWAAGLQRRDRARGQLHMHLSLVLRAQVDPILDALRTAGLHPARLQGAAQTIPLVRTATTRWERRAAAALAGVCAVLALALLVVPFVQQSLAARAVETRIAALRPAVDRVEAMRRGLAGTAAGLDVLASERAKRGDALGILAALTDVLPDDTVLTDLALRQLVITMSGQSAAAARLIPALAADPAIRNPTFAAPVTRNETGRNEGFSIRAEAAP